jgi:hypothetical protein
VTILKVELTPPTPIYTRAEINRAFGLGEVDPGVATVAGIGIVGVAAGLAVTGLVGYFIWRVAKKQRWV